MNEFLSIRKQLFKGFDCFWRAYIELGYEIKSTRNNFDLI